MCYGPNTHKTFVGLKIARLLLQARKRTAPPILCVCYTNHALDQVSTLWFGRCG